MKFITFKERIEKSLIQSCKDTIITRDKEVLMKEEVKWTDQELIKRIEGIIKDIEGSKALYRPEPHAGNMLVDPVLVASLC